MESVKRINGEKSLAELSVFPDMNVYSSSSRMTDQSSESDTVVLLEGYSDVGTDVDPERESLDVADVLEDGRAPCNVQAAYKSVCDPGVREKIQRLTSRDQSTKGTSRSNGCDMEEPLRPGIVKDMVNHASITYWCFNYYTRRAGLVGSLLADYLWESLRWALL